jgi:capsular polysaccharide transport system permease protein
MTYQTTTAPKQQSIFLRGLRVQANVVGALILRELHTRYGRENIGYLWMVLEPMTLAVAVSSLHVMQKSVNFGSDIQPVPFTIVGYCVFIIFRQIIGRSEGVLESNAPLLYHRMVSIFDMVFARSLLETAGVSTTLFILLGFAAALGFASLPARPLDLMAGIALMAWFSFAMSMIVCALTNENRLAARLVHPILYIMMPISGAFYRLQWLPEPFRTWMSWYPMTQIFELVRYGQFHTAKDTYVHPAYIIGWCMALTYIGLISLKIVRRHIHLR